MSELKIPKGNTALEGFATTLNNLDDNLGKTGDRCFHIGSWGGCGPDCAAFVDGECPEPQELDKQDIINEHGEEVAEEIFNLYSETWED